ncbi:PQQ-dependent sugar dehydrogenase [Clostridium sp. JN-1]|uniref:PQQ-dependent sugar dehydrogenase n=1 Tax=Clostridium sp. JN-1 TaxID=2483110 RepID=UPI000F0B08E1|nr:PQQ-dependent sugar dehydrogenase [Clostridium sp. JN-1]
MKKIFKILLLIVGIICIVILISKYIGNLSQSKLSLQNKDKDLDYSIKYKGMKGAVDFTVDNLNNYYIAYKDKIQVIENSGKSYYLFKNKNLNISSIDFNDNKLYFASDTKVYSYDLKNKKMTEIVSNLPNYGDYKNSIVRVEGEYIYITLGAATNSGVVGEDNKYLKDNPFTHDISPKDIVLKGINFGEHKTGAFQSYNTRSTNGQIISGHFPGNASIMLYNTKTGNSETFAWGIRNVTGMDFNSQGKLFTVIGGMENRGLRPVKGDSDYIYEIKKGNWYGWPDYSGGDPIISPRFRLNYNSNLQFVLENHPTTNPPAPIYQYNKVNSMRSLAIDKNGVLGTKDCMYFYDRSNNIIYAFNGVGSGKEEIKLSKNAYAADMKFYDNSLLVLDSNHGYIYSINKHKYTSFNIDKKVYLYLIIICISGIVMMLVIQKK